MSHDTPLLHMICGKIAAGKSTLAKELAKADPTILISEDAWLHALFGDQMASLQDYVRCAARLRTVLGPMLRSCCRQAAALCWISPPIRSKPAPGCAASLTKAGRITACICWHRQMTSASPECTPAPQGVIIPLR